jgi:hypothetical protein
MITHFDLHLFSKFPAGCIKYSIKKDHLELNLQNATVPLITLNNNFFRSHLNKIRIDTLFAPCEFEHRISRQKIEMLQECFSSSDPSQDLIYRCDPDGNVEFVCHDARFSFGQVLNKGEFFLKRKSMFKFRDCFFRICKDDYYKDFDLSFYLTRDFMMIRSEGDYCFENYLYFKSQ